MKVLDKEFAKFIVSRGAELLEPTNEWEVLRFRSRDGIGVVYKNKYDNRTYSGTAIEAIKAFKANNPSWNIEKTKRKQMTDKVRQLLTRDGGAYCFYCGKMTTEENRTVEHILAIGEGGNNALGNLALACDTCNFRARNLSVVEKIKLRDKLRAASIPFVPNPGQKAVLESVEKGKKFLWFWPRRASKSFEREMIEQYIEKRSDFIKDFQDATRRNK